MTVRKKCDRCGAKGLQRQFYIWRREDLDDPEAFDMNGAEPTDMGSDYWCDHCEAHTFGEEYDDEPEDPYPIADWRAEVANCDTKLGYTDWLLHRIEAEEGNET